MRNLVHLLRSFAVCSAIAAVGAAHAQFGSYELLLVADQGTRSVHRFDPVTGAYFGSFGGGGRLHGALDVAADRASGQALVHEGGGRIIRFNYSTGLYTGQWQAPSDTVAFVGAQGGDFLAVTPRRVIRFNLFGVEIQRFEMPAGNDARGADVAADGAGGVLVVGMTNATTWGFDYATGATLWNQGWNLNRVKYSGNRGVNLYLSWIESNLASRSGISAVESATRTSVTPDIRQPSWGHGSWTYFTGRDATNLTRGVVGVYDFDTGLLRGTFGQHVLVDPRGTSTVLVPEPGTLLALGAGALALLARRRRRR
jgi:hypothetical protein